MSIMITPSIIHLMFVVYVPEFDAIFVKYIVWIKRRPFKKLRSPASCRGTVFALIGKIIDANPIRVFGYQMLYQFVELILTLDIYKVPAHRATYIVSLVPVDPIAVFYIIIFRCDFLKSIINLGLPSIAFGIRFLFI